jgi:hypothetical protein
MAKNSSGQRCHKKNAGNTGNTRNTGSVENAENPGSANRPSKRYRTKDAEEGVDGF